MAETTESKTHKEALKRFARCVKADAKNREAAREDFAMAAGKDHWPEDAKKAREGRPQLVSNRLNEAPNQVVGDLRQNVVNIKVRPVDNGADTRTAETNEGIIRNIEYQSKANSVYNTARKHITLGGFGYFRFVTEYINDASFNQEIKIKRVRDPFSVYIDPDAQEPTGSDAKFFFITEDIPKEEFERLYPGKATKDFEGDGAANGWIKDGNIRRAEYWVKTKGGTKKLYLTEDGKTHEKLPEGAESIKEREVATYKIEQYIMSGADILEGPHDWPSETFLPIVRMIGRELVVDGEVIYEGLIRQAKDDQRSFNYFLSALTENVALTPKAPFLLTPKQVEGHEGYWRTANTANRPYLLYNSTPDGRPQREAPPALPTGIVAALEIAKDNIHATTGKYEPSLGMKSNEKSGVAIRERNREGDVGSYEIIDNSNEAIEQGGRIILDLIPKVYDTARIMRIRGVDGEESEVPVNQPAYEEIGPGGKKRLRPTNGEVFGGETFEIDLKSGNYDCYIDVGPAHTTQRAEAAEFMTAFMQNLGPRAMEIADIVVEMKDVPGAEKLRKRIKKMLPPGLVEPEEGDEPEQPQPNPGAELEMAKLDLERMELQIKAEELQVKREQIAKERELNQTDYIQSIVKATIDEMKLAAPMQGAGMREVI